MRPASVVPLACSRKVYACARQVFAFFARKKRIASERILLKIGRIWKALDKFDLAILHELQADARLTNAELAQRVGLSAAPCWRRVRALEEAGFIKGYHAEIDRHKIGLGVLAFVRVDAERNTGERHARARRRDPQAARGGRLPLHQRHRHLRAAGGGAGPRRASRALRASTCCNLPNVKDLHTSFSLGEVKASQRCRSATCAGAGAFALTDRLGGRTIASMPPISPEETPRRRRPRASPPRIGPLEPLSCRCSACCGAPG